jgi:hypothetical protein
VSLRHPNVTADVLDDILRERGRQDSRWGQQDHKFGEWLSILMEEIGEACREHQAIRFCERADRRPHLRTELVQAAAVAAAIVECGDRNGWFQA